MLQLSVTKVKGHKNYFEKCQLCYICKCCEAAGCLGEWGYASHMHYDAKALK